MLDAFVRHPKSDACRLCLASTGPMEHIFSDPAMANTIAETVRLKVFEGDGLPELICQPCIDQLKAASRFIQRCHLSDSELRLPLYTDCGRSAELEVIVSNDAGSIVKEPRLDGDWACSLTPIKEEHDATNYAAQFSEVNLKTEVLEYSLEEPGPSRPTWNHPVSTEGERKETTTAGPPVVPTDCAMFLRPKSFATLPEESRVWCSQCNASFVRREELVRHVRSHRGQRSYCCSRCDKGFHSQQALKVHTKTHAKEKRYKCSKCDKSFSLRSYFRVHELTHRQK